MIGIFNRNPFSSLNKRVPIIIEMFNKAYLDVGTFGSLFLISIGYISMHMPPSSGSSKSNKRLSIVWLLVLSP